MWRQLMPGFRMTLWMTVLTGLAYPGVVTAICQAVFPAQANGSLVVRDGKVVGSALLGQSFSSARYFHSRPSAAGSEGYDASVSGGSNLGPTSQKLIDRVAAGAAGWKQQDRSTGRIPADALTASGSGLDPHISPAFAHWQVARVARERGMAPAEAARLVDQFTEGRDLGLLGEPRVNVLLLNLALDERSKGR